VAAALFLVSPARIIRLLGWLAGAMARLPGLDGLRRVGAEMDKARHHADSRRGLAEELCLCGLTVLVWSAYFGIFFCLMHGVGMDIDPVSAVAIVSGMTLVSIIPFQTIGGLGLVEIGQASLYVLAGYSAAEAATQSLAVSGLFLALCVVVPSLMWAVHSGARMVTRK
jgi:uncharacterized membrane protein YbhN (UPF0104 family)